jgi:hypothetical protein
MLGHGYFKARPQLHKAVRIDMIASIFRLRALLAGYTTLRSLLGEPRVFRPVHGSILSLSEVLHRIVERIVLRCAKGVKRSAKGTSPGPKPCRCTRLAGLRDSRRVELGTDTVTILVRVTRLLKSADLSIVFLVEVLQPAVENV